MRSGRYHNQHIYRYENGEWMESMTNSKKYWEGVKKVGPGCKFYYRCIFDPVPNEDLKDPAKYGVERITYDEQQ